MNIICGLLLSHRPIILFLFLSPFIAKLETNK